MSQVLSGCVWLVGTILGSTDREHFHLHRKFCWQVLFQINMDKFSVSLFWENKRKQVIEITPGHCLVLVWPRERWHGRTWAETAILSPNTCRQHHLCRTDLPLQPCRCRITTEEHSALIKGRRRGGGIYSSGRQKKHNLMPEIEFSYFSWCPGL